VSKIRGSGTLLDQDLATLDRLRQCLAVSLLDGMGQAVLLRGAFNPAQHSRSCGEPRAANLPGSTLAVAVIRHGVGPSQALISHQAIQQGSHPREMRGVVDIDRARQGIHDPGERLTWEPRAARTAPPGAILPAHVPLLR
jgi:hypothetical protein